jgi:hypothetical protein
MGAGCRGAAALPPRCSCFSSIAPTGGGSAGCAGGCCWAGGAAERCSCASSWPAAFPAAAGAAGAAGVVTCGGGAGGKPGALGCCAAAGCLERPGGRAAALPRPIPKPFAFWPGILGCCLLPPLPLAAMCAGFGGPPGAQAVTAPGTPPDSPAAAACRALAALGRACRAARITPPLPLAVALAAAAGAVLRTTLGACCPSALTAEGLERLSRSEAGSSMPQLPLQRPYRSLPPATSTSNTTCGQYKQ